MLPDAFTGLFDGFRFHFGLVSTTPGADPQAVDRPSRRPRAQVGPGPIIAPKERSELAELERCRCSWRASSRSSASAPWHTRWPRPPADDATTSRCCAALGMRPRNSSAIVFVQAGAIGLVGLAIGLPLGLALGRVVWRTVANDTPVEFVVPDDWSMIAVIALVVVALAALLAVWPSRRLAHPRSRRRTALRMRAVER